MRIMGGQIYDVEQGFVSKILSTAGEQIASTSGDTEVLDATGCYVIPGLTDLHFHGCVGEDFSDGSPEGLVKMAEYELSRGVTQICPAGMTLAEEQLRHICKVAAHHRATATTGATLVGVHLEGPFLSSPKRGAQNGAWLQTPDIDLLHQLEEDAEGLVKLVSLAPELEGAIDFIRQASQTVTVSLAHTESDYDLATQAFEAGAAHVTHLYNAMMPFTHRAPGVVGAAFDSEKTMVELICDGIHIHPSVVRATFRMFGAERMVLVSDTMRAAGLSDGEYTLGGQAVTVTGKLATLEGGVIAGSVTDLLSCLQTAVSMGIPLADAVRAAAVNPAKILGIDHQVGTLEVGKEANLVLLNQDYSLKAVIYKGQLVSVEN